MGRPVGRPVGQHAGRRRRPRRGAGPVALAVVGLVATTGAGALLLDHLMGAASPAPEVAATTGTSTPHGATATPGPTPSAVASEPVRWTFETPAGYSPTQPEDPATEVRLTDPASACVLQLTLEDIGHSTQDELERTAAAADDAVAALGARPAEHGEGTIRTSTGELSAHRLTMTAPAGPQEVRVRLLLRATGETLAGITQLCPAETADEESAAEGWDHLVRSAVLHGVPTAATAS